MSPAYARGLANEGSFRLQTLSYYRELEETDPGRGDAGEGTRFVEVSYDEPTTLTPEKYPSVLAGIKETSQLKSLTINPGGSLRIRQRHVDGFVFCTTAAYRPGHMGAYGNACVQIDDPQSFFAEITTCLARLTSNGIHYVKDGVLDVVTYGTRVQHFRALDAQHLCFLKEPRHADDREVRAYWHSHMQPINHLDLVCRDLPQYCHLIS
jgi:hypothetical protein